MKVSIITVTYNSASTIGDTLESVANQTYPDIEHIIIDGLSSDNTLSIINKFPHIANLISEPDNGIYDAMNKGINLTSGEIIGILNSDDVFASNTVIQEIVESFITKKNVDAIYGNISYFNPPLHDITVRYWKSKSYYPTFFEDGEILPHPSLFVKKKVYDEIGLYKKNFKIGADYEFIFRMMKIHEYSTFYFDKTIVKMRIGGVSTNNFKSYLTSFQEVRRAWKLNGINIPFTFYFKRYFRKFQQLRK